MISKMTHTTIFVLDQQSAYDFYVNKLGFNVVADVPMPGNGGARWLTVCPPEQPGFEIILALVSGGVYSPETTAMLKELVAKGTFGSGLFTCRDLFATYEEMVAKGVVFTKPPTKEFYGTEAIFKDDSGNWFSLAQLS